MRAVAIVPSANGSGIHQLIFLNRTGIHCWTRRADRLHHGETVLAAQRDCRGPQSPER